MATFTALPLFDAAALLSRYALGTVIEVSGIPAGSVNSNYRLRVRQDDGREIRLFVRIFEEQGELGARRDAQLTRHLANAGVPTPSPLCTRDGEDIVFLRDKPVAVFPFIEGSHACQQSVDASRAGALGEALATVHRAGASFGELGVGRFGVASLRDRLAKIASAKDPELAAMAEKIGRALDETVAERRALPQGLVHGDLFRDNVLFASQTGAGHDRIAALLDFESASEGPLAYDLAVCILSWCYGDSLDWRLARAIVEGYRTRRALEVDEWRGLRAELSLAALRFTITRITDYAMREGVIGDRVVKDWRRFWARYQAVREADVEAQLR